MKVKRRKRVLSGSQVLNFMDRGWELIVRHGQARLISSPGKQMRKVPAKSLTWLIENNLIKGERLQ